MKDYPGPIDSALKRLHIQLDEKEFKKREKAKKAKEKKQCVTSK